jgi:putative transposase
VKHLDEVFIRINGELPYLRRAVDPRGVVLDILVEDLQNAAAVMRFFKQLLQGCSISRGGRSPIVYSYGVAYARIWRPETCSQMAP